MHSTQKILILLLLFFSVILHGYAQLNYEKGYFIDNDGNKTEGLIENHEWKKNPILFYFKSKEGAEKEKKIIHNIQEFGIHGKVKFQREFVDIDRSSGSKRKVEANTSPTYTRETVFLNVLVEGQASLFQYEESEMRVYFFKVDDKPITQLISRDYLDDDNIVVKDQTYIRQLFSTMRCGNLRNSIFEDLRYTKTSLEKFFQKYNSCNGGQSTTYKNKDSQSSFHLAIRPGISINTINIPTRESQTYRFNTNFGNVMNFRLGAELEYMIPRMNKRWSILFEPSFQQFTTDTVYSDLQYSVLIYKTIEASLGLKYYFNNRNATRFFATGKLVGNLPLGDSRIDFENSQDIEVVRNVHLNVGVGILVQNRLSLEGNYWFNRNLSLFFNSFNTYSLILGYRLF